MKQYSKVTPEGTKDVLFRECVVRRRIGEELAQFFSQRSYHEVMTPGLEFFDVFGGFSVGIPQEAMYKTTDKHGRLVVMRPDSTVPIARLASTRLKDLPRPIRLFYHHPVYRSHTLLAGRSDEMDEFGIELLGAAGLRADLEAISAAMDALRLCIGEHFRVEIGHAGVFRSLARRLPVDESVREDIRAAIESKNYAELSNLLEPLGHAPEVEAMRRLPRLFGGAEVFQSASALGLDEETLATLSYLEKLYFALCRMGLEDQLIVDLGLVQRNDYYTGVVFSAYVEDAGEAVLNGGRYDRLLEGFGCPMPAIGFSLRMDMISAILLQNDDSTGETGTDVLVHSDEGYETLGFDRIRQLTDAGLRCENSVFSTREEAENYARTRHIAKIVFVGTEEQEVCL